MRTLLLVIGASLFLTACGGAGLGTSSSKLDIKVGSTSSTLTVKSGAVYYGNVISTAPGKPNIQTFAHTIYIANYEMDTSDPGWSRKPLSGDQMRVDIQLTGEEGTKDDSPFKVATYSPKADKFNKVRSITIITFANGKETRTDVDTGFNGEKVSGDVKITSITADTVSGEVNLSEGDKSIKGGFTAKLPAKKK
jgi:hypothetical protein